MGSETNVVETNVDDLQQLMALAIYSNRQRMRGQCKESGELELLTPLVLYQC